MPYLTIFLLFVEIWTMWSPQEAKGNEKALVKACPFVIVWIQRSPNIVLCWKKIKLSGEVHEENDGKSTIRVDIKHMVQRKSRNRVVEGKKW